MSLKRRRTVASVMHVSAPSAAPGLSGSRFVDCPICGRSIAYQLINSHLDTSCTSSAGEPQRPKVAQGERQDRAGTGTTQTTPNDPQGVHWWQQPGAQKPLIFVPSGGKGSKKVPVSYEELQREVPSEMVQNVLPKKLADRLLRHLIADAPTWHRGQWIMFGKTHAAPRTSCYYSLADGQEDAEESDDYKDVSQLVDRRDAPADLREAARIIDDVVRRLGASREPDLAPRDRGGGWSASYALANHYADGQETVGAHADRLTPLGKCPTIASLSLGATRMFRLKRADPTEAPKDAGGSNSDAPGTREAEGREEDTAQSPTRTAPAAGAINSVDFCLEHNTLVIMWPPTQEEWRHEVPRSKNMGRHPISGAARVNLTFRRLDRASAARAPLCRCGNQAVLKASLNRRPPAGSHAACQQGYYFACDNTKGSCGFWRWDDEA